MAFLLGVSLFKYKLMAVPADHTPTQGNQQFQQIAVIALSLVAQSLRNKLNGNCSRISMSLSFPFFENKKCYIKSRAECHG
jgi:hypothetical protein